MRVFGYVLIFLLATSFTNSADNYLIIKAKRYTVEGATSLGTFSCTYMPLTKDTLFLNKPFALKETIPVKAFGCGNFLLNHDFRKTLKEKKHPTATIVIKNLQRQGTRNYSCNLLLQLAGKSKTFQNLSLHSSSKGLTGTVALSFSDFNLQPPNKLGGAIKVEETIMISIEFETQ